MSVREMKAAVATANKGVGNAVAGTQAVVGKIDSAIKVLTEACDGSAEEEVADGIGKYEQSKSKIADAVGRLAAGSDRIAGYAARL